MIYWQVSPIKFFALLFMLTDTDLRSSKAPEMRRYAHTYKFSIAVADMHGSGPYNPLKVDVWSLGATVWEMAQTQPPFADATDASQIGDQLPPLDQPRLFSQSFHVFLQLCSRPCLLRPDPDDLLNVSVMRCNFVLLCSDTFATPLDTFHS